MSDTQFEYADGSLGSYSQTYGSKCLAQTFTIGTVGANTKQTVTSIKINIKRTNTVPPSGNFTVCIYATDANGPTGAAIETKTIALDTVGTSSTWYEYTMAGTTVLNKATQYAIVVHLPQTDNRLHLYRGTLGYTGGKAKSSDDAGSTWSDVSSTADFGFYIYGIGSHEISLTDTLSISDDHIESGEYGETWVVLSYLNMCGSPNSDGHFDDSTPTNVNHIHLHKPYYSNADGSLSFESTNLSFRSGNYKSYIDSINDEEIHIRGYENVDAMIKFNLISQLADYGEEIEISGLKSTWDGIYVISSFSYLPIGIGKIKSSDTFEYKITLKFVRDS